MEADNKTNQEQEEPLGGPREINLFAWYGTIALICLIIIGGGLLVWLSYLPNHRENQENWRPGKIARLEEDLEAINRDGREVSLGELRGKIYVVGYQYTDCPGGCLGMASVMKDLLDTYGHDARFHLVSISVDPESDTPEKMDKWVKDRGVESDNWWFLTGDAERIKKYMLGQFKFYASEENTDPKVIAEQGPWAHDQRLMIVDGEANIRGFYGVMHPVGGPTAIKLLKRDLDMVMNPDKRLRDYEPIEFPKEAIPVKAL